MDSREVARKFFSSVSAGDFSAAFESMSDDATWTITGTTAYSKTFDKQGLLDEVVPMLMSFKEAPRVFVDEIIAENDRAVVVCHASGVGPHGPYTQGSYAFILRVRDDKVSSIVEYLDTVAVESAICGRVLVDKADR